MKKTLKCTVVVLFIIMMLSILIPVRPVSAYSWNNITSGAVYNIKNKASGKYLNVNFGTDANGTNVNQWTKDGSIEQKWKVVDVPGAKMEVSMLFAMCSSNGNGRVLDILRTGGSATGSIQSGCNVDIWATGDDEAQWWKIDRRSDGYYVIWVNNGSNIDLCLTAYGTSNGSGSGTSPTSAGNVFVSTYTGADNQLWSFELAN